MMPDIQQDMTQATQMTEVIQEEGMVVVIVEAVVTETYILHFES